MKTIDIVHIALFTALIAALGLMPAIPLPFVPVPITAQTLGVMLAGSILGAKKAGLSLLLFLCLVAFNLPLLPGGRGGLPVFYAPTAGYLIGWPFGAFVIGFLADKFQSRYNLFSAILFNIIGGIIVIYAFGIAWLVLVTKTDLLLTLKGNAIFLIGDAIKAVIAAQIAISVRKYIRKTN